MLICAVVVLLLVCVRVNAKKKKRSACAFICVRVFMCASEQATAEKKKRSKRAASPAQEQLMRRTSDLRKIYLTLKLFIYKIGTTCSAAASNGETIAGGVAVASRCATAAA